MIFNRRVLRWFTKAGRKHLPWQENPNAYRVWISEIMLQQTQVNTVIPYYHRFMKAFPDVESLAKAKLDQVLALWTGLGYYARARNLHQAAKLIMQNHAGKFPITFDKVLALPGIGRSTAGAILAISQHLPYAILDGNVKRVLCRYFAIPGFPGTPNTENILWEIAEKLTPKKDVAHYTQAMMDLGATICRRSQPKCEICPLNKDCQARQENKVNAYPEKRPRKSIPTKTAHLLILSHPKQNAVLLEKRPAKGVWGGLWSLPEYSLDTDLEAFCKKHFKLKVHQKKSLPSFRHTFTHFHLEIVPVMCEIANKTLPALTGQYAWHHPAFVKGGLPAPVKRLLSSL